MQKTNSDRVRRLFFVQYAVIWAISTKFLKKQHFPLYFSEKM